MRQAEEHPQPLSQLHAERRPEQHQQLSGNHVEPDPILPDPVLETEPQDIEVNAQILLMPVMSLSRVAERMQDCEPVRSV